MSRETRCPFGGNRILDGGRALPSSSKCEQSGLQQLSPYSARGGTTRPPFFVTHSLLPFRSLCVRPSTESHGSFACACRQLFSTLQLHCRVCSFILTTYNLQRRPMYNFSFLQFLYRRWKGKRDRAELRSAMQRAAVQIQSVFRGFCVSRHYECVSTSCLVQAESVVRSVRPRCF